MHLENAVPMTLPAVPRKRENMARPRSPEAPVMTIVLESIPKLFKYLNSFASSITITKISKIFLKKFESKVFQFSNLTNSTKSSKIDMKLCKENKLNIFLNTYIKS